jgi:hypothetical protein
MLDKTIKEAHLVDAAIPNSHNLHSTNTGRLQQYTELKREPTRRQQLKTAHTLPPVLSTEGITSNNNKKAHTVPPVLSTEGVISNTNKKAHTVPPVLSTEGII